MACKFGAYYHVHWLLCQSGRERRCKEAILTHKRLEIEHDTAMAYCQANRALLARIASRNFLPRCIIGVLLPECTLDDVYVCH
ncbi:Uncharacterised protein [Halioglobus japonicus]|nr:Uncharacterised protein [Halioglobus japonicus]